TLCRDVATQCRGRTTSAEIGRGGRNRTHVTGVGSRCPTIERRPQKGFEMYEGKHRKTPVAELEQKLRDVFKENRDVFEELVIRGWPIELALPTLGMETGYGYAPSSLSDEAGFIVSRAVTPAHITSLIENKPGTRERFR